MLQLHVFGLEGFQCGDQESAHGHHTLFGCLEFNDIFHTLIYFRGAENDEIHAGMGDDIDDFGNGLALPGRGTDFILKAPIWLLQSDECPVYGQGKLAEVAVSE